MKSNMVVLGLLMLLLIGANVNADTLSNFTRLKQGNTFTCWAACVRMTVKYYGMDMNEDEIVRLAFNVPDSEPAPNGKNDLRPAAELLARLLITTGTEPFERPLTQGNVVNVINDKRPILAGARAYKDNNPTDTAHMYVIAGYQGSGDGTILFVADPRNNSILFEYSYDDFLHTVHDNGTEHRWETSIYPTNPPPAPKQNNVHKVASPVKTINAALNRINTGPSGPWEIIHLWDTTTYQEQVIIDNTKPQIYITSTGWLPPPVIKSPHALRILDAKGIEIQDVNIEGDSAVYNTGSLYLRDLTVSAPSGNAIHNAGTVVFLHGTVSASSGYAIYNTGTLHIDYFDGKTTVSSTSSDAIYNSGTAVILNGIVSAASGYTAIHNNSGTLTIVGNTELKTASGSDGNAINNNGVNGSLLLGGSPTITGHIKGFGAKSVYVQTSGIHAFTPGNKKYILEPRNLKYGDVVVVDGARFINNFELADTTFALVASGGNLVAASSETEIIVAEGETVFHSIWGALYSAKPGQVITIIDSSIYNGQVTIDSTRSGITIRSRTFAIDRPVIKYFPNIAPAPRNYAGLNKQSGESEIDAGGIEESSALRVFGARGILIDGVDIEGENGVYNTGAVTIRNGTVSATSSCAIYNTGLVEIANAAVSASDASGYAIYNYGGDGELVLGGSVDITGRIAGFGAGRVSVYTFGDYVFNPGNRKYVLAPADIKDGDVVVVGGAEFIDNFELADSSFVLAASGGDLAAVSLSGEPSVSVLSPPRVVPPPPKEEAVVIPPAVILAGEFTAGPNPVAKQSGAVKFYRQGKRVSNCELRIYDAAGNVVGKVKITDNALNNLTRRHVGSWDLKDRKRRQVPEGTYLVKGVLKMSDGNREKISLILGIR